MYVKQLIEKLSKCDQDAKAEIKIYDARGFYDREACDDVREEDGVVYIIVW